MAANIRAFLLLIAMLAGSAHAQQPKPFAELETFLHDAVKRGVIIGGTVLVEHKGKTIFHSAFGFADREAERPFTRETPAIVASISKPLLGTALHRLADTHDLNLDEPITAHLPAFTNAVLESGAAIARPPTTIELLTHSAGVRNDSAKGGRIWFQAWTQNQPHADVVSTLAKDFPFKNNPGTKAAYSGIGTEIAARIAAVVADQPRNEMLRTHLALPLGMTNTWYRDAHAVTQLPTPLPTQYHRDSETGNLTKSRVRVLSDRNRYSSSGGTIVSTAPDLLRWLRMIRDGGQHNGKPFLRPETAAAFLRPHPIGKNARGGLFVRARAANSPKGKATRFGHTGSSGTNVWIDFETDTIGIMLTQTSGRDIKPFRVELEKRVGRLLAR